MSDREPIFNIPAPVALIGAVIVAVHLFRLTLSQAGDVEFLLNFAFIPARFDPGLAGRYSFPGGVLADYWVFLTHAFIHADWAHLLINGGWLVVFGSAVAWRFGAVRFLLFYVLLSAAGAAAHLFFHHGEIAPMVGASGAISGLTAAALRFVFSGGRFAGFGAGEAAFRTPATSLGGLLRNRQVMIFIAVWVGLNVVFGAVSLPMMGGESGSLAYEAHLGGFVAGLLLFGVFDPVRHS